MQLAKHFGATVTGCAGLKRQALLSLGADDVIDYTREDFTKSTKAYDLILDTVAATTYLAMQTVVDLGRHLPALHHGPDRHVVSHAMDLDDWR